MFPSYRNQSVDLQSKSTDWFLYDGNIELGEGMMICRANQLNGLFYMMATLVVKRLNFYFIFSFYAATPLALHPLDIYLFKVNNGHTGTMCEICSKITIKTPKWHFCLLWTDFTLFCCFNLWLAGQNGDCDIPQVLTLLVLANLHRSLLSMLPCMLPWKKSEQIAKRTLTLTNHFSFLSHKITSTTVDNLLWRNTPRKICELAI